MKHVVALSGGKDSTAMALYLKEQNPEIEYTYVVTPTGDELPEMFEHWRKLAKLLGTPLTPVLGGTLSQVMEQNNAIPNWRMRFCTRQLKIEPFIAFMNRVKPAVSYVGLRADEPDRQGTKYNINDPKIEYRYPLREAGIGLKGVWEILARHSVSIPKRTDCARCFFQRLGEWYGLWRDYPDIFASAIADEERYGHTFRSKHRDTWPASLRDLSAEFESGRVPRKQKDKFADMKCRECTL